MLQLRSLTWALLVSTCALGACSPRAADEVLPFPPTTLYAVNFDGKYGLVDSSGRVVLTPQFDELWPMSGDLTPAAVGDRWGYIDHTGRFVVSPQYEVTLGYLNGLAPVQTKDGRWGFIDERGQVTITPQFDRVWFFTNAESAPVAVGERWGFIGRDGKFLVNPQFDGAWGFDGSGLAPVAVSKRWGYIDRTGHFVINPQFDAAGGFASGRAPVKIGGRWGYIDRTGAMVIAPQFDDANEFSDGVAAVTLEARAGYIGPDGKYVINPQFEGAESFNNGMAVAYMSGHCGFIDGTGRFVIAPQFASCTTTNGPLLRVHVDTMPMGAYAYLTRSGREVARDRPPTPASSPLDDISDNAGSESPPVRPNAKRVVVRMYGNENGYYVQPKTIHIHTGDQVVWRVASGGPHNIAFARDEVGGAAAAFDRAMPQQFAQLTSALMMNPGETYTMTFAGVPPGTYSYHCTPHWALGEGGVIVVDP